MNSRALTLQVPASLALELDSLGRELVAELLELGLRQWRTDRALDRYLVGDTSLTSEGSSLRRAPRPSRKSSLERHAQLLANTSGTRSRISFA